MTILAITGMRREARIVAGEGIRVIAGAGPAAALMSAPASSLAEVRAVISLGLAGALLPGLRPGDWLVAQGVVWAGGASRADPGWTAALLDRLPDAATGWLFGSDRMLLTAAAKQRTHAATRAAAVDMESQLAATLAARLGAPFAAARVISDAAERDLPEAVAAGLSAAGRVSAWPVIKALAHDSRQVPRLVRTALDAERAFRSLVRGRRRLGARLACPDLSEPALDVG